MFNFNLIKMSKFEKNVIERLSQKKDTQKIAERAYKKAINKVSGQISSLKYTRVELEDKLDDAVEALEGVTYCEKFDINEYDAAKNVVDSIDEQLADIDRTIEARMALLELWK